MRLNDGRHLKVPGAVPVLSWATFHGLDPVWARIGQEGILKVRPNIVRREVLICLIQSFQTARLEGLLDSLYKEPESLPEQEVSPGNNSARKYCHFWQQGNFSLVQF